MMVILCTVFYTCTHIDLNFCILSYYIVIFAFLCWLQSVDIQYLLLLLLLFLLLLLLPAFVPQPQCITAYRVGLIVSTWMNDCILFQLLLSEILSHLDQRIAT